MNIFSKPIAMAETMLANSPAGILVYEGDTGNCVLANQAVANMLSGSIAELKLLNFRELACWCQADKDDLAETVLHDGLSHHHEVTLHTSFGKIITLDCSISRYEMEGKPFLIFIVADITERRQMELGTLVRDIIRELESGVVGRNIEWHIGDFPKVSGDVVMLRIVLTNLITNALKFIRPREQAQIEIGSLPGREGEATFFVGGNGVGFDMTYVDKVFGVFHRLHRTEEFEGAGIGLANVHRIIARHGGRTWAEWKVDQGATFYFSLPHSPPKG